MSDTSSVDIICGICKRKIEFECIITKDGIIYCIDCSSKQKLSLPVDVKFV